MSKHLLRALLGVAMLAILATIVALPAMADTTIYSQATDLNGSYASQNDASGFGNFATAYDNFTLGADATITSVNWVGNYFNPGLGSVTGFTLNIYSNAGGAPGALLYSTGDVAGNANETSIGLDNAGNPAFTYTLGTNFLASAGTEYWMSIESDMGFPPQWGWETGTGGDGAAYQCFFGSCGSIPNDLAFSLAVPEPSSFLLLAGSLPALALRLRRKRQ